VYGDLGFWFIARSRMLLGVGLPLIFVPIMAASYDGIPQSKTDRASALIDVARNTGGSIGVSIISNVLSGNAAIDTWVNSETAAEIVGHLTIRNAHLRRTFPIGVS
jgi:hypothetical protein